MKPQSRQSRDRIAIWIVFFVALVMRLGYVLWQGPPAPLAGDAAEYGAYAQAIGSRAQFAGPDGVRATRMPGYPMLIALVAKAAGPSTRALQLVQCLLGALACVMVFWWAQALLGAPWPLICGLAAAVSYDLIAPASWTLTECLYSFLLAASFCVLYRESLPIRWRAMGAGFGFGVTALVRPEVLPFSFLILGAASFIFKGFSRRSAALALAAFLSINFVWVVRNALVFRRFVPVSTVGGWNGYLGLYLPLHHLGLEPRPIPTAPAGIGEIERDAFYRQNYRELRRTTSFVNQIKAYTFNLLTVYYPFLPSFDWTYATLIPFWLWGVWRARSRRELWPIVGLVAGLSAMFAVLAGPVSRYRFGFAPCLILLAGVGAESLRAQFKDARKFAGAAGLWATANVFLWLGSEQPRRAALWLKDLFWR